MQVFWVDEDGNEYPNNLSHLGAVSAVNFADIAHGFLFQEEGKRKNFPNPVNITQEQYKAQYEGIERCIRPHKQRDEGERRLGCPDKPTREIAKLLNRYSRES